MMPADPPEPEPEPEEVPVGASEPPIRAYYVELPKETFAALMSAVPPVCRFSHCGLRHSNIWFYDAEGKIVIFSWAPVKKLEHRVVQGWPDG